MTDAEFIRYQIEYWRQTGAFWRSLGDAEAAERADRELTFWLIRRDSL